MEEGDASAAVEVLRFVVGLAVVVAGLAIGAAIALCIAAWWLFS